MKFGCFLSWKGDDFRRGWCSKDGFKTLQTVITVKLLNKRTLNILRYVCFQGVKSTLPSQNIGLYSRPSKVSLYKAQMFHALQLYIYTYIYGFVEYFQTYIFVRHLTPSLLSFRIVTDCRNDFLRLSSSGFPFQTCNDHGSDWHPGWGWLKRIVG